MQTSTVRAPNLHAIIHKDVTVADASTITTVWTPASGKRVVLMGWDLSISAAATIKLAHTSDSAANRFWQAVSDVDAEMRFQLMLPDTRALHFDEDEVIRVLTSATAAVTGTLYGYEV